jgi:hypothetical protein
VSLNVDTPDYQRGIVNAQVLLAEVVSGTGGVIIGIPPNAETLVICASAADPALPEVVGRVSGIGYAGAKAVSQNEQDASPNWFFDVSSVVDTTVEISFDRAVVATWYVYADAGVHIVADVSKNSNAEGTQYVIGSVPSTSSGDHPPNEVLAIGAFNAASGVILAAPGAGLRYRVFSVAMAATAAGLIGQVNDTTSGQTLGVCAGPGSSPSSIPAQGFPMTQNHGISYQQLAGAGSMLMVVFYTVETV